MQGAQVSKSPPPAPENLTNGNADNATLTDGRKQVQYADSQVDSDEYAPSVGLASKSGQDAPASAPAAAETLKAMLAGGKSITFVEYGGGVMLTEVVVQDEAMKNLMMSWYYAGYYTGLYEGKQQGYARAVGEKPSGG